jgi:hypothetical protein
LTVPTKASLFVPCFVDQLLPEGAVDTVLRRIGYAVCGEVFHYINWQIKIIEYFLNACLVASRPITPMV